MSRPKRVARLSQGKKKSSPSRSGVSKRRPKAKSRQPKKLSLMAAAEAPKSRQAELEKVLNLYRPVKKPVTIRLDADVIDWFRKKKRGYQTRINRALRKAMVEEMKAAEKTADPQL